GYSLFREGYRERHASGSNHRERKRDVLEARLTRHNVRRKPGVHCGSACHHGPDRERVQGKCSSHGRLPLRTPGRLGEGLQDRGAAAEELWPPRDFCLYCAEGWRIGVETEAIFSLLMCRAVRRTTRRGLHEEKSSKPGA